MSGPIRKSIGPTHKCLINNTEAYRRNVGKLTLLVDEINNLKESYKTEFLTRKEEDNPSRDDFSSVKETPIMTATPSAPIAQSTNSTLEYLLPVTIPLFYENITRWPVFWKHSKR
uniref:Uncharacterized protein n=1 Tax=Heterorhabditis bacteriophora TaxID=37862 RepID=A0A1I7WS56_HETBA